MNIRRSVALSLLVLMEPFLGFSADPAPYTEQWRPQYHFSPPVNWMNDPNGLVYFRKEYHLFYQYNPFGIESAHKAWAHAVSRDLVHWKLLPLAIPERDNIMAYSGSAVVDWGNTSGFGAALAPPLVAIYTGCKEKPDGGQAQYIAYSNDRGRTWREYPGNPVIDRHLTAFRDPKVFWYPPAHCWEMVVSLSNDHRVIFYRSHNLKDWSEAGHFGPSGCTAGVWECPDLFTLPVAAHPGLRKWVLTVNTGAGAPYGGSGCQYFVGDFDGSRFTPDPGADAAPARWVDAGRDFYASVTWSDLPRADGRRLWMGWMTDTKYCRALPTFPWRGNQSLVRELDLVEDAGGFRFAQHAIAEYRSLREGTGAGISGRPIPEGAMDLAPAGVRGDVLEIEAELEPQDAAEAGLLLFAGSEGATRVGYDAKRGVLFVDRPQPARPFDPAFGGRHEAAVALTNGRLKLHLFLDRSTLEVFTGDGTATFSELVFPAEDQKSVLLYAKGGAARLTSLRAWPLKSIWR